MGPIAPLLIINLWMGFNRILTYWTRGKSQGFEDLPERADPFLFPARLSRTGKIVAGMLVGLVIGGPEETVHEIPASRPYSAED